jgi:hypothetical protein
VHSDSRRARRRCREGTPSRRWRRRFGLSVLLTCAHVCGRQDIDTLRKEIGVLKKCRCESIVSYFGVCFRNSSLWVPTRPRFVFSMCTRSCWLADNNPCSCVCSSDHDGVVRHGLAHRRPQRRRPCTRLAPLLYARTLDDPNIVCTATMKTYNRTR